MPEEATLVLHGRYPYCRYFEFALYPSDPLGSFTSTSEAITDDEIAPDNDPALTSESSRARETPMMERFFYSEYMDKATFEVKGGKK